MPQFNHAWNQKVSACIGILRTFEEYLEWDDAKIFQAA